MDKPNKRWVGRGKNRVAWDLHAGERYVVDPPWSRHSAKHVGRVCVLLSETSPWSSEKLPVRFVDDGKRAGVLWYFLRKESHRPRTSSNSAPTEQASAAAEGQLVSDPSGDKP